MAINEKNLSDNQLLVLEFLEDGLGASEIAARMGVSRQYIYTVQRTLTDEIIQRQRDKLAVATIKAVDTTIAMMDADATTEKGELRLKASESIMSRSGLTNHTSVEVMVESENGIFLLPGKSIVPANPDEL